MNNNKPTIEQYLNSLALNTERTPVADVLMLVENPFISRSDLDPISLLFHRFYRNTDIHPALPIFTYLGMLSAFCVNNKANYKVPLCQKPYELDTWVLLLADSGSSKSMAEDILQNSMPSSPEDNKPVVQNNISMPASNAAFIEQIKKLNNHRGFWKQDEASQFIKQIDQISGPMASIKQSLLLTKDHSELTYSTKKEGDLIIKNPVLTILFINTILAMKDAMKGSSMYDGIFRRFTVALADSGVEQKEFKDCSVYNIEKINDEALASSLCKIFSQDIYKKTFTFTEGCLETYDLTWNAFWVRQYEPFMINHKNYYRTYMMESWKYAILHHISHRKPGTVVDEFSLQWGLKVSMFLLNSLQSFLRAGITKNQVEDQRSFLEKFIEFINANDSKQGFGIRAVCRKFHIKKDQVMKNLQAIKLADKKFKTKLLDDLAKWEKTQEKF